MKTIKRIAGFILNLFLIACSTPWIAMTIFGALMGGFAQSFMTGFRSGVVKVSDVSANLAAIRLRNALKKTENQKEETK